MQTLFANISFPLEAILPASVKACLSGRVKSWPVDTGNYRGDAPEAHGEGLNVLLILEEGTGRNKEASGWVQISNVCQPLSLLAGDFV